MKRTMNYFLGAIAAAALLFPALALCNPMAIGTGNITVIVNGVPKGGYLTHSNRNLLATGAGTLMTQPNKSTGTNTLTYTTTYIAPVVINSDSNANSMVINNPNVVRTIFVFDGNHNQIGTIELGIGQNGLCTSDGTTPNGQQVYSCMQAWGKGYGTVRYNGAVLTSEGTPVSVSGHWGSDNAQSGTFNILIPNFTYTFTVNERT